MEDILLDILERLRAGEAVDEKALAALIRAHNRGISGNAHHHAKRRLMPYYLQVKAADPQRWESWQVDPALEQRLLAVLRLKPRRSASGVATITVLTKPWPCSSDCLYCPCDVRMPKSYLADEPACQRAEHNFFDPYLQVASRLRVLTQMGHVTDKVELIVLGGTWNDYPEAYRIWFVTEMFRALDDGPDRLDERRIRRARYRAAGMTNRIPELKRRAAACQQQVDAGTLAFGEAVTRLHRSGAAARGIERWQVADLSELEEQQRRNETAAHRVVGLVVETRPDAIDVASLTLMRRLGCTKVQMGVQSLDERVLRANDRHVDLETIRRSFALLRLFGFKIHIHFMVNLYGSTPEADRADYLRLVSDPAFLPDEVKLYPCSLVAGTRLVGHHADGSWRPYTEDELVGVLVADTLATPPYVRISRMIRDISSGDILAGNRKVNLRQMVERRAESTGLPLREIRHREIGLEGVDPALLVLDDLVYRTAVSCEHFLQWVTPEGAIAGFLRLSLPDAQAIDAVSASSASGPQDTSTVLPVRPGEAMIREVHVYGAVAGLHTTNGGVQHLGLGRRLVRRACAISREQGYTSVNVISAVGTREYYRGLGFSDAGLYQRLGLQDDPAGQS